MAVHASKLCRFLVFGEMFKMMPSIAPEWHMPGWSWVMSHCVGYRRSILYTINFCRREDLCFTGSGYYVDIFCIPIIPNTTWQRSFCCCCCAICCIMEKKKSISAVVNSQLSGVLTLQHREGICSSLPTFIPWLWERNFSLRPFPVSSWENEDCVLQTKLSPVVRALFSERLQNNNNKKAGFREHSFQTPVCASRGRMMSATALLCSTF